MISERPFVIFFDGHCVLCHFWVKQVLKYDAKERFSFAELEGKLGQDFLKERGLETEDSIVLWQQGQAYWMHSAAICIIAKKLGGIFNLLALFRFLPTRFTDGVYRLIARNRKLWFGTHSSCPPPPTGFKERFIS